MRNVRRDGNEAIKKALKDKKITEDEERRSLEEIQKLTDAELRAKTDEFRQRIQERLSRFRGGNTDRTDSEVASEQEDDLDRTHLLARALA